MGRTAIGGSTPAWRSHVATRRRVHPVYVWGGLAILVSEPLRLAVSQTPLWLAFGDWLKG
jgi:hypothetical protein